MGEKFMKKNTGKTNNKGKSKKPVSLAAIIVIVLYFLLTGELPTQENITGTNNIQQSQVSTSQSTSANNTADDVDYEFRSEKLWMEHFEKHGEEMGFDTAEEYLEAANDVIDDPDVLHKTEKEDGDDIYYLEDSNEFVVVSTDGYLRTYFEPSDGMAYYERQ